MSGPSKGPDWKGWLPIASWSFGPAKRPAAATSGNRPAGSDFKEAIFSARAEDVPNAAVLFALAASGEPFDLAKLAVVPDAVGDWGSEYFFSDCVVTSASGLGRGDQPLLNFGLAFESFERREALRFR
jgi:hypothetical protein